jgi:hypothetical protein
MGISMPPVSFPLPWSRSPASLRAAGDRLSLARHAPSPHLPPAWAFCGLPTAFQVASDPPSFRPLPGLPPSLFPIPRPPDRASWEGLPPCLPPSPTAPSFRLTRGIKGGSLIPSLIPLNLKSWRTKGLACGRNSVVECQLPKLDVVGSNPIARYDGTRELRRAIIHRRHRERPGYRPAQGRRRMALRIGGSGRPRRTADEQPTGR